MLKKTAEKSINVQNFGMNLILHFFIMVEEYVDKGSVLWHL